MSTGESVGSGRFEFTQGRVDAETALRELESASGIGRDELLARISELNRSDLAFGMHWAADAYGDGIVGRWNAMKARDWVVLHVPAMNVAGDAHPSLEGVNRSYAIDTQVQTVISGGADFYGAENYLSEHVATARTDDPRFRDWQLGIDLGAVRGPVARADES